MQQSTRHPARRSVATKNNNTEKDNDKKNLMSRQYTSSFSGVDWGGMLGNSFRSKRGSDFAVGLGSIANLDDDDEFCVAGRSSSNALDGGKKAAADSNNDKDGDGNINNNDDMESTGSKLLVEQILSEAQNSENSGRFSTLWKGRKMKKKGGWYVPKKKGGRSSSSSQGEPQGGELQQQQRQQVEKQRGKSRVRFSFNFDADDEEDDAEAESGHHDGTMATPAKNSSKREAASDVTSSPSSSSVCHVILMLLVAIILGIVLFAFAPLNISSIFIRGKDSREEEGTVLFGSERGQEMLELAEQINIVCGDSILLQNSISKGSGGMMSTCQSLCHNNMCCFEKDEEYSCKDDVTKDCGVYAGCVVLIDDNFW